MQTFCHKGNALFALADFDTTASNLSAETRGMIFVKPKVLKLTRLLKTCEPFDASVGVAPVIKLAMFRYLRGVLHEVIPVVRSKAGRLLQSIYICQSTLLIAERQDQKIVEILGLWGPLSCPTPSKSLALEGERLTCLE